MPSEQQKHFEPPKIDTNWQEDDKAGKTLLIQFAGKFLYANF